MNHINSVAYQCIACQTPNAQYTCGKCGMVYYCSITDMHSDQNVHIRSGECNRVQRLNFDDVDTKKFDMLYARHENLLSIIQATTTLLDTNQHDENLLVAAVWKFAATQELQNEFNSYVAPYIGPGRMFELLFVCADKADNTPFAHKVSREQIGMLVKAGAPSYRAYNASRYPVYDYSQQQLAQPFGYDDDYLDHIPAVGTARGGGSTLLLAVVKGRVDLVTVLLTARDASKQHVHTDLHTNDIHIYALLNASPMIKASDNVGDMVKLDREQLLPLHYAARGNALKTFVYLESLLASDNDIARALNEALKFDSSDVIEYIVTKYAATQLHERIFNTLMESENEVYPRTLDAILVNNVIKTPEQCIDFAEKLARSINYRAMCTLFLYVISKPSLGTPATLLRSTQICDALARATLYAADRGIAAIDLISGIYPHVRLIEELLPYAAQHDSERLLRYLLQWLKRNRPPSQFADNVRNAFSIAIEHTNLECTRYLFTEYEKTYLSKQLGLELLEKFNNGRHRVHNAKAVLTIKALFT